MIQNGDGGFADGHNDGGLFFFFFIIIDWTPGPDDDVGLPAVQMDHGLLLPAVPIGNSHHRA